MFGTKPAYALLLACLVCLPCACSPATTAAKGPASEPLPEDKDPTILLARGKAYAAGGDLVRAEQYLSAALAAHGDEREVLPPLLQTCVRSRHFRLASEYAEVALARRPNDVHLRFLAGALYVSIGEYARARDHLEQAAKELPDDAELQFAVAVFFRDDVVDLALADPYFREYLRIEPHGRHADEAKSSLLQKLARNGAPAGSTLLDSTMIQVPQGAAQDTTLIPVPGAGMTKLPEKTQ